MDTTERRRKMGPPAWRANNRQHPPKPENIPAGPPASLNDLGELTDVEMANMALSALVQCLQSPSRHNLSRVSAAKELLAFTKAKPATKQDINHSGGLAITVSQVEAPD